MKSITHSMAVAALGDSQFRAAFPEFTSAVPKVASVGGCKSCASRRAQTDSQESFFKVLSRLPESRIQALKGYFEFGNDKMLVTIRDANGGVQLKAI